MASNRINMILLLNRIYGKNKIFGACGLSEGRRSMKHDLAFPGAGNVHRADHER